MPRLLFEKKGNAAWMSHLDLMRLFQRAFKRAGLPLTHTQGFNPRPSVSIALPLSVGTESNCELLDFTLEGQNVPCNEILRRLNSTLVDGVRILDVYEQGRKIRELALLRCVVSMEYDHGVPEGAVQGFIELFSRTSLIVQKKAKGGIVDQDIIPMIRSVSVMQEGTGLIWLDTIICCQNPTLNPTQFIAAIDSYMPEYKPDFFKCIRMEIYDNAENVFR